MQSFYSADEIKTLRLEEVELSDDSRFWKITLGWVEPASRTTQAGGNIFAAARADIVPLPRVYKQFLVNGETGQVASMKIREP
ncbi:MAG: hypothetical protein JWO05_1048 [Gemmatimonadetes bacterium]|nr:hypothetical protein [Gemmatimonadota bacterium]